MASSPITPVSWDFATSPPFSPITSVPFAMLDPLPFSLQKQSAFLIPLSPSSYAAVAVVGVVCYLPWLWCDHPACIVTQDLSLCTSHFSIWPRRPFSLLMFLIFSSLTSAMWALDKASSPGDVRPVPYPCLAAYYGVTYGDSLHCHRAIYRHNAM